MNEKTLEKITKLSRRQIIMLQKSVIQRKNKIVVGLPYDYSDDEVEQFLLAKIFKDCGYTYSEIKKEIEMYYQNQNEVINNAILKVKERMDELDNVLKELYKMKFNEEEKI